MEFSSLHNDFLNLPNEITIMIAHNLNIRDLETLSKLSSGTNAIACSDTIFNPLVLKKYPYAIKKPGETWFQTYMRSSKYIKEFIKRLLDLALTSGRYGDFDSCTSIKLDIDQAEKYAEFLPTSKEYDTIMVTIHKKTVVRYTVSIASYSEYVNSYAMGVYSRNSCIMT